MISKILNIVYGTLRKTFSHLPPGKVILFESLSDFDGNAKAVYDELVKQGYHKKYKLVWAVKKSDSFFDDGICTTIKYMGHGLSNLIYENRASIIFFDDTPPARKRDNIKFVYLSHGCPTIKNCEGIINKEKIITDCICTGKEIADNICKQFNVTKEQLYYCGLPRNDKLNNNTDYLVKLTGKKFDKNILWMPTFRKHTSSSDESRVDSTKEYYMGLPAIKTKEELDGINEVLSKNNASLIIKFHPGAKTEDLSSANFSNIILLTQGDLKAKSVDIYDIFSETDALISDYSSVVYDYMLVDKPIGYVVDDMNEYKIGFAFDNILDYMPGHHILDACGITEFILDICNNRDTYKENRNKVLSRVNDYPNGDNAKRIVDLFMN